MTRARNLANLGNKNAITADIGSFNIGIGSTQPHDYKLEVVGGDAYIGGGVTITGNLSVGGTVTYEDVTNVDAVGIITANSGVNIVGGGLTVTGVGTFFGAIDANGALDVDGHTELDDVNVSGASTFAGLTTVTNAAAFHSKQLNVSGVATVGGNFTVGDTIYLPEQIVHTGDTNTKIKFPANDTISFETGADEKLRIGSDGIVEMRSNMQTLGNQNIIRFTDTDTSVSAGQTMGRLQWYSSDASGGGACVKAEIEAVCTDTTPDAFLAFKTHDGSGTTPSTRLKITSAGRLLLGTTVDSVFNGGRNASFQQEGTTAATSALAITRNSDDANPAYLSLGKSRGTSVGANTAVQNGDDIGTIEFNAGDGSGSFNVHALIKGSVGAAPGNSDAPGRLSFWTTPDGGSTTPAERLRIHPSGLIEAKARTAEVRRMILSGSPSNASFNIEAHDGETGTSSGDVQGKLGLFYNDGSTLNNTACLSFERGSSSADGALSIVTNSTERLRIKSNGFLGIGTINPSRKLHVFDDNSEIILVQSANASGSYINYKLGANGAELGMIGSGAAILSGGADAGDFGIRSSGDLCFSTSGHVEKMRLDTNGKLGIGTISPYALLTVMGTAENGDGTSFADHGIMLHAPGATDEQIIPITGCFETSGLRPRAGIGFISHPTVDPIQSYAGEVGFYTRDAADGSGLGSGDEKMRINRVGRVGIGQTDPNTLLHVAGNGTAVLRLENTSTGMGQDDLIGAVEFEKQDASGAGVGIAGGMRCRSNDSYGARSYLAFSVRSNSTGAAAVDTEVIRMTTSGICFNGDITDGGLNDYEEGSWTPAPSLGSLTPNNCRYVRVGRKVTVWANISGITELSSGNQFYLTGLPFTTEISQAAGSMMGYDINSNDTTTAYISHTERLYFYGINAGTSWETNSYTDYTANSQFYVVATYEAT